MPMKDIPTVSYNEATCRKEMPHMEERSTQNTSIERRDEPPEIGGSTSTVIDYTLRFTGAPSIGQLVAVAVASAVYIVLSWLAIIALPSGVPVVSSVFLAIGFGIP